MAQAEVLNQESLAKQVLQETFGYQQFRPGQETIIETVLEGRDCLVVMPTGGGKSLCYQVPALVMGGLTVVVSPLISLMKDQVDQLLANGVAAACLNSTQSREQQQDEEHVASREIKTHFHFSFSVERTKKETFCTINVM